MEHIPRKVVVLALVVGLGFAVSASASPNIDSAKLNPYLWHDCPDTVLTPTNTYARNAPLNEANIGGDGCVKFHETNFCDTGWANRHNWRFSADGGTTDAVFQNADAFEISACVTITGTLEGEAALQIEPWWSESDGVLMVKTEGEIVAWGGRLPFYSFTANDGITYTRGETIGLKMQYLPRSLTEEDPGIIKYTVGVGGTVDPLTGCCWTDATLYESPWLAFDQGNPEEPEHGFWGILTPAEVGGTCAHQGRFTTDPSDWIETDWCCMRYYPVPEPATLTLLGLMGLAVVRKRR